MKQIYKLNTKYFEVINTHTKAYILGLIFSDGSIEHGDKKIKHYRLRFSLQKRDKELLLFIVKKLRYSGPIRCNSKYCYLDINNKSLVLSLLQYGLHNNKSLDLKPPKNLDKKFYGSFIRGVLDGDGCVALYKRGTYQKPYVILVGTKSMMLWIRKIVGSNLKLRKQFNSWVLNLGGFRDIYRLIQLMNTYKNGLHRKTVVLAKIAAYIEKSDRKIQE